MTVAFQPRDRVRARLWPELGTGVVLTVSKGAKSVAATRVAEVEWSTGQTSTHSFVALKQAKAEPSAAVKIYYCPNSGQWEQKPGGGFDTCCDTPERHVPLPAMAARPLHVMSCDECRGDLDSHGHFPDCSQYGQEAT